VRQTFDDRRLLAIHAALHFGFRRTANDHDIVATAGIHQGLLDAFGKHTHGREHEYDQGHSPDGQECRYPARPEIAMNVIERNGH